MELKDNTFSEFIRNASREERIKVYDKVISESIRAQNLILHPPGKYRWTKNADGEAIFYPDA